MRALITGACGFVGTHLVRELAAAGHEVIATDLLDAPPGERARRPERPAGRLSRCPGFPDGVAYCYCDLLNRDAVRELVADTRPDCIYHLAAQSSAARSLEDPHATLETNIFGTFNVLEAVRLLEPVCPPAKTASGRIRVLSVGSAEEYGRRSREELPLREASRVEPVSPYAVSKAAQTMLALQYASAYGLDVVATRSFSHTGAGQSDRFVLPSFARQCAAIKAGKRTPVVRVGNIGIVRDFLDVRDVARAYRMLVESGAEQGVYNVCSGAGLPLGEALSFFREAAGVPIAVEEDPERLRPSDIPILVGANDKLRRACGWEQAIPREAMLGDLFAYWERIVRE